MLIKSMRLSTILFAVNSSHTKMLSSILWQFVWGGRTYNINKEICLLPKHMGGLGMIDLHTMAKVKRVKWVIIILKAVNTKNWGALATKYLECLDKEFGMKMFASRANE